MTHTVFQTDPSCCLNVRVSRLRRVSTSRPIRCSGKRWDEQFSNGAKQFADHSVRNLQKSASRASQKFQQFVEDKQLKEKAEQVSDTVSRKAKETFDEADKKYGLKLRVRNLWLTVKEQYPSWKRQATAFVESPLGRACLVAGGVYLLTSGIFFQLLNIVFFLLWILPLFLPFILRYLNKKVMEEAEQQRASYQQDQFGGLGADPRQSWYTRPGQQFQAWASRVRASRKSGNENSQGNLRQQKYSQQAGPVIDAEWTTIDDD